MTRLNLQHGAVFSAGRSRRVGSAALNVGMVKRGILRIFCLTRGDIGASHAVDNKMLLFLKSSEMGK
jgi:hypothetical protein